MYCKISQCYLVFYNLDKENNIITYVIILHNILFIILICTSTICKLAFRISLHMVFVWGMVNLNRRCLQLDSYNLRSSITTLLSMFCVCLEIILIFPWPMSWLWQFGTQEIYLLTTFNFIEKVQGYFTKRLFYHCNLPMLYYNNGLLFLNIANYPDWSRTWN